MHISLLIIIIIGSFATLVSADFAISLIEHPKDMPGINQAMILFFINGLIFAIAFVLLLCYLIFAKPVEATGKNFSLESFRELSNGYEYSYYDDDVGLMGGFVERETAELDFYDEEPFINIHNEGYGKKFWFIYDGEDMSDHYTFHVIDRKGIEINKIPK